MGHIRKSIDGISPLPQKSQPHKKSPSIHGVSSRRRVVESEAAATATPEAGGVFMASSFSRSLQPVSLDVEPERFVEARPLY